MRMFKDADGREWTIRLTIGAVDRVKGEFDGKVDILNLASGEPPLVSQLDADPALLTHVIYALVKNQNGGVPPEGFTESVDAPTFRVAEKAFWDEMADFFQIVGRTDLCRLIEAQKQVREEVREAMTRQVDEHLQIAIEKLQTSGRRSGNLQESAA